MLQATAAGDHRAFAAFVERHQDAVFRFLTQRTLSAADREDALQETFLAAYRGCDAYRGEASARAWLLGIARNLSRKLYRRRAGEPEKMEALETLGLRAGWGEPDPPEALLETLARRDVLEKAMERLSPDEREVLVLREMEGLSGEETARVLGLGLPAMKSRLHRARLRLAAALRGGADG